MANGGEADGNVSAERRQHRPRRARSLWHHPKALWPLLAAVPAFLLGRATLLGLPGIFALAWVAALRATGSKALVPAMIGALVALIGQTMSGSVAAGPSGWVWATGALGIILVVARARAGITIGPAPRAALGAAAAVTIAAILDSGWRQGQWLQWLAAAALAGTTGLLALILVRGAEDLGRQNNQAPWHGESALALVVMALGCLAGLEGIKIGPWVPSEALAAAAVMGAGWAAGPLAGAATGMLAGLARLISGIDVSTALQQHALATMILGISGLLGGAFRDLGRAGVAVAFGFSFVLLRSLAVGGQSVLSDSLLEFSTAVALIAWVPRRQMERVRRWLQANYPVAPAAALPAAEDPGSAAGNGSGFGGPLAGLARIFREMQTLINRSRSDTATDSAGLLHPQAPVISEAVERVCRGCSMYPHCWQQEFFRTYQVFTDVWELVLNGNSPESPQVPDVLERYCSYPREVMAVFRSIYDLRRAEEQGRRRLAETRMVMAEQMGAVADLLDDLATIATLKPPVTPGSPRYRLKTGIARTARKGSLVSGDTVAAATAGHNQFYLLMSDGMGGGKNAAAESQQAVRLAAELLEIGCIPASTVRAVNTMLLMRDVGDCFATLDLAVVDLISGLVEFVKAGTPPAFIKRGRNVQIIRSEAPPVGMIHPLPITAETRQLGAGDWLVLVTDGLWDYRNQTGAAGVGWLTAFLTETDCETAQALAEAVLAQALALDLEEPKDDITVLAARLLPVAGPKPAPGHGRRTKGRGRGRRGRGNKLPQTETI